MTKWKAFAVFFTLLFFGSLRGTLFVVFSTFETVQKNKMVWLTLAVFVNLVLLYLAVRFWQRTFKADNNRPD